MSLHIVFLLFRIMSKTTYQKKKYEYFLLSLCTSEPKNSKRNKDSYTDRFIPFIMFTFPKQN